MFKSSCKSQLPGKHTLTFNGRASELKVGYKIIASLNVPVGEDFYRPSNSQAIEIVDESGEGFKDYDYPEIHIDETELVEGAKSLHLTLTGDERLFKHSVDTKDLSTDKAFQINRGYFLHIGAQMQLMLRCSFRKVKMINYIIGTLQLKAVLVKRISNI